LQAEDGKQTVGKQCGITTREADSTHDEHLGAIPDHISESGTHNPSIAWVLPCALYEGVGLQWSSSAARGSDSSGVYMIDATKAGFLSL